ncbi:MAG: hypothetical protein ABSC47_11210 [Terracidiphilus sp.]|jgi:non-canonical (house-cleaning) NTP pyrophosphatase
MAARITTTKETAERILPSLKKNGNSVRNLDPRSPSFTREFKRAAKAFTLKATRSPETALAVLVEAGIYTPSGKLTKNYR